MKLFYDAGVDNIEDYNKAHATGRLRHLVWACDEAVDIFDKTGASKARKAQIEAGGIVWFLRLRRRAASRAVTPSFPVKGWMPPRYRRR